MKKLLSQWRIHLAAILLVGGLMMISENAQAQLTVTAAPVAKPTWTNSSEASQLITQEIDNLNNSLNQQTGFDGEYIKYKIYFLELVQEAISTGVPLNKAVELSFNKVAGEIQVDSSTSIITETLLNQMFNEVVDLLTN